MKKLDPSSATAAPIRYETQDDRSALCALGFNQMDNGGTLKGKGSTSSDHDYVFHPTRRIEEIRARQAEQPKE